MMKRLGWITALLLATGLGGLMIQFRLNGQELRRKEADTKMTSETISGSVKKFLKNKHGDVDGLLFDEGKSIHFPPHMGEEISRLVSVGDRIEVRGNWQTKPEGDVVLEAERINKRGESINIESPSPPRGPRPAPRPGRRDEQPMEAKGTIEEFVTNPHGDVDGLLLSDGTNVKVPPHQGAQLQNLTKLGTEVQVEGRRHETPKGEIHLHADRITATATGRTFERDEPRHRPGQPPHEEILRELREIRRLIESQSR